MEKTTNKRKQYDKWTMPNGTTIVLQHSPQSPDKRLRSINYQQSSSAKSGKEEYD